MCQVPVSRGNDPPVMRRAYTDFCHQTNINQAMWVLLLPNVKNLRHTATSTRAHQCISKKKKKSHAILDEDVCVTTNTFTSQPVWGWGCSSVDRASDRHAADVGTIPRCGKGFFSQSQLSVQTLFRCPYTPVCNRMHLHLCAR